MARYLFALDFDGTVAETFTPCPGGLGVHGAYEKAIEDVLGKEGLKRYHVIGGLRNRAPSELVRLLLEDTSPDQMIGNARIFFRRNGEQLADFVPKGKGVTLAGDFTPTADFISELVVRQKLFYLSSQIGTPLGDGNVWPAPCRGFIRFYNDLAQLDTGDLQLDLAIVSSGHELFIGRTFMVWGLSKPEIIITEDDIRGKAELEGRVKPDPLSLELACAQWLGTAVTGATKQRVVYIGDDPVKDGGMAERFGVSFGWFDRDGKNGKLNIPDSFTFSDWEALARVLKRSRVALCRNKPIWKILLPAFS